MLINVVIKSDEYLYKNVQNITSSTHLKKKYDYIFSFVQQCLYFSVVLNDCRRLKIRHLKRRFIVSPIFLILREKLFCVLCYYFREVLP